MELRCPECVSPEVECDRRDNACRCGNCGERFPRDSALVTVYDAEAGPAGARPTPLFTFDPAVAESELRKPDGGINAASPYSDADELQRLLRGAQVAGVIESKCPGAAIYVYPLSIAEPDPLLGVDLGAGPTLLGFELKLRCRGGEDPVAFTVRFLAEAVEEANDLAAGRAADSDRLDRLAAYLNGHRPPNGGDVCQVLAEELHESGRGLAEGE